MGQENNALPEKTLFNKRNGNIDLLRLLAAIFVMSGHMAYICGGQIPQIMGTHIHALGVYILFTLSGALIVKSWCSDPNPLRYLCKRVFRIFPPLIVFVLLMAYVVGPLLTSLSVNDYFHSGFEIYLRNILLYPIYGLPGVFGEVPYTGVVNGSLWTIPVEVAMYCIIPIVLTATCYRNDSKKINFFLLLIVVAACATSSVFMAMPDKPRLIFWGTDWIQALDIVPFYFIGMLFASPVLKKYLNLKIAIVALTAAFCLKPTAVLYRILLYILIPYCCFSFAEAKPFISHQKYMQHEISYGIYLYGFFFQQLTVHFFKNILGIELTQNLYLFISLILTCGFALLSEKFVERSMLQLSKKICIQSVKL